MSNNYPIDGEEHEQCEERGIFKEDINYKNEDNPHEKLYICNGCGKEIYYD